MCIRDRSNIDASLDLITKVKMAKDDNTETQLADYWDNHSF